MTVFGVHINWVGFKNDWVWCSLAFLNAKLAQQKEKQSFGNHCSKSWRNACARTQSKRQICSAANVFAIFIVESFWIELGWVWPVGCVHMHTVNWNPNCIVRCKFDDLSVALQSIWFGDLAIWLRNRRPESKHLWDNHIHVLEIFDCFVCYWCATRMFFDFNDFIDEFLLNIRIASQLVGHKTEQAGSWFKTRKEENQTMCHEVIVFPICEEKNISRNGFWRKLN